MLKKLVAFFDWVVYILLCIVAIGCIIEQDVIQKFIQKNTDHYETEIDAKEFSSPEFYFCDWTLKILKMEKQHFIQYANVLDPHAFENVTSYPVNNGGNPYAGNCFIVSPPPGIDLSYYSWHYFLMKFNSTLSTDELPPIMSYVSAKNNPLMFKIRHDGNIFGTSINAGEAVDLHIKEERTISLPENCRSQPILEYMKNQISETEVNCTSKCWPKDWYLGESFETSLKLYPRCRDTETNQCMTEQIRSLLKNAKKLCKTVSYTGRVASRLRIEKLDWLSKVLTILSFLVTVLIMRKENEQEFRSPMLPIQLLA